MSQEGRPSEDPYGSQSSWRNSMAFKPEPLGSRTTTNLGARPSVRPITSEVPIQRPAQSAKLGGPIVMEDPKPKTINYATTMKFAPETDSSGTKHQQQSTPIHSMASPTRKDFSQADISHHSMTSRINTTSSTTRLTDSQLPGPPSGAGYTGVSSHADPSQPVTSFSGMREMAKASSGVVAMQANALDDAEFCKDVLFMWFGASETKFFRYDKSSHKYTMDGGNLKQQNIFKQLEECGSLCHQINDFLNSRSLSFLQQSLKNAIRKQITMYFSHIGSLQTSDVTVTDLLITNKRVHPKLQILHRILTDTENAKGGELVTKLQFLNHQGSKRMAEMLSDIYIETVHPLLTMTVQWITRGEAPDPFVEFFISVNDKIVEDDDVFWIKKYSLRPEMLPVTFDALLAQKILLVGKNINFIRRCCRAKDWRIDSQIVSTAQNSTFDTMPVVVGEALKCTNAAVMRLLTEKFKVFEWLKLLRSFMLVANDDFFEPLIGRLEAILSRPSTLIHTSSVQEQVQATTSEIYSTINADIGPFQLDGTLHKSETTFGWDAFQLKMTILAPLNHIFDRAAMLQYSKLFRVMWKVKCAEVAVKKAWRSERSLDRVLVKLQTGAKKGQAATLSQLSHQVRFLGHQLGHFVRNMHSYLVYEVIMTGWQKLQTKLQDCPSMDDLKAAHNAYLEELLLFTLLHEDCGTTRHNIDAVLDLAREYAALQKQLETLVERGQGDVHAMQAAVQKLSDAYHEQMALLLTTLEEQHLKFDFLNFLGLRLNFNQFYHQIDEVQTEF